ncbi:MAG: metal-dependent hydrolase [Thermoplasmata archaeon]|nr:MAG: metal-dependent hydrolase [Thermoplasmata archaeon]
MPSWKVHISVGIILTALMIYGIYTSNLWDSLTQNNQIQYFFWFQCAFIAVLGSVLPDFDYGKTKIRHGFGPVLGAFVSFSYIYVNDFELEKINPLFLITILIIFLLVPLIAGFVIPFEHHGKLHSISAASFYALCIAGLGILIFLFAYVQAGILALFGFTSYFFHLLLDRELKLI